jgi:hypothetical protein
MRNPFFLRARTCRAAAAALVLSLAAFVPGCGDDDESDAVSQEETLNSLNRLGNFGRDLQQEPGVQVLNSTAVTGILNVLPLNLPGIITTGRTAPAVPAAAGLPPVAGSVLTRFGAPLPSPVEITGFGTYHYDSTSTAGPFEGWVLEEPGVPEDGFRFRFTEDDGFFYQDEDSNRVAIQGEIRVLEVTWDEGLAGPGDDILTHAVFEIAAGHFGTPTPPAEYPVLVHVESSVDLDEDRAPTAVRVGDITANGSTDPEAAFVSSRFLFALEVDLTPAGDLVDAHLLLQVYDTLEDYVLRLVADAEGVDEETETADALTLILGYGVTTNPGSPPWLYTVTLENFREDPTEPEEPDDEIADVSGSITFQGDLVATIFGNSDVTVHVDDDGVPDCPNIWFSFTANPSRLVNVCEVVIAFGDFEVPLALAPLVR